MRRFVILYANVATTFVTTFVRLNVLYPLKSQTDCVQHSTVDIELRVCAIEAVLRAPPPTKLRPRKQAPSDTAELARRKLQRHSRVGAFIQVRSQCAVHATAVSVFANISCSEIVILNARKYWMKPEHNAHPFLSLCECSMRRNNCMKMCPY